MKAVFLDFESLSLDPQNAVVLSCAAITVDMDTLKDPNKPFDYQELLEDTHYIKFAAERQVAENNRKICPDTLKWWLEQGLDAQKQLLPNSSDKLLSEFPAWLRGVINWHEIDRVYNRNNSFDHVLLDGIHREFNELVPYQSYSLYDTRSTIEGMTWGQDIKSNFIIEGLENQFVAHDPIHDVVMDVMRFKYLSDLLLS